MKNIIIKREKKISLDFNGIEFALAGIDKLFDRNDKLGSNIINRNYYVNGSKTS